MTGRRRPLPPFPPSKRRRSRPGIASAACRISRCRPSRSAPPWTAKTPPGAMAADRRPCGPTPDRRRAGSPTRGLYHGAAAQAAPSGSRCHCSPSPQQGLSAGITSGRPSSPGPCWCGVRLRRPPWKRRRHGSRASRRRWPGSQAPAPSCSRRGPRRLRSPGRRRRERQRDPGRLPLPESRSRKKGRAPGCLLLSRNEKPRDRGSGVGQGVRCTRRSPRFRRRSMRGGRPIMRAGRPGSRSCRRSRHRESRGVAADRLYRRLLLLRSVQEPCPQVIATASPNLRDPGRNPDLRRG